jgi:hypothetical protein
MKKKLIESKDIPIKTMDLKLIDDKKNKDEHIE